MQNISPEGELSFVNEFQSCLSFDYIITLVPIFNIAAGWDDDDGKVKLPSKMGKEGQALNDAQGMEVDGANNRILSMIRKFRSMMWSNRESRTMSSLKIS